MNDPAEIPVKRPVGRPRKIRPEGEASSFKPTKKKEPKAAIPINLNRVMAELIVEKYVKEGCVDLRRDFIIAYKLTKRHPDIEFWKKLPVKNKVNSLVILWSPASRRKLDLAWKQYQHALQIQRKIVVDTPANKIIIGDKVGQDYSVPAPRPRTAIEFCR